MSNIEKYLNKLIEDKTTLANNLTSKGVTASSDDTFTELVPKVLDIQTAEPVTKGFIVNEFDESGYPTDISIVGMTEIPNYYFSTYNSTQYRNGLSKSLQQVNLPDGLTLIGTSAFEYNTLKSIQIPDSVTSIKSSCFRYCTNLETIKLPENLSAVEAYCFYNCSKMTLSELPDSLTKIEDNAFYKCSLVTFKEIPAGVTIIYYQSFYSCSSLTELTFLGNVTEFRSNVFNGCSNLKKIVMPNVISVPSIYSDTFNSSPIKSGTGYVYVPDALLEDFKVATNWSTIAAQIKGLSELPIE